MKICSKEEAISRMNTLAKADVPFLFIIDYTQQHSYIEVLDEVDAASCLFQFPQINNVASATDGKYLTPTPFCGSTIDWQFMPPAPDRYREAFDLVKRNLIAGNSYLTNLTCKIPLTTNLTLKEMFLYSKASYKLWIKNQFVCFSPEIFVRIKEGQIKSFPMKGTIDATLPDAEAKLMNDEKEAAEHATIVDLIRNDLSMVANKVTVTSYRYLDRLQTNKGAILQTSSEISGVLPDNYHEKIGDILFCLLPAGSVTGAPKPKTAQIIAEAEDYERNFYTGVMGCYANKQLDSAVMIRFVEQESKQLFFKAGGGITAKSEWESEYNEIKQKVYVPIY